MDKVLKLYIFPSLQSLAAIYYINTLRLPEKMHISEAIFVIIKAILIIFLMRIITIIIAHYIINIGKLIIYKFYKKTVVSICIFPFYYDINEKKFYIIGLFQIYEDRTCFSMKEFLLSKNDFERLTKFVCITNRILAIIYIMVSLTIVYLAIMSESFIFAWVFAWGMIEHFFYQRVYGKRESVNGLAFAGIYKVNLRLLLHLLFNQSKIERLDISGEVCEIISKEMYDIDGGYYFDQLCIKLIYQEVVLGIPNNLIRYVMKKIDNIYMSNESINKMYSYIEQDKFRKCIPKDICVFFDHYYEYFTRILMYFDIKGQVNNYIMMKNYITVMLERVESECVKNTHLSKLMLEKSFAEYQDTFYSIQEKRFTAKKSIFIGYGWIYEWNFLQTRFVEIFNSANRSKI